jgi:hypothetical protein
MRKLPDGAGFIRIYDMQVNPTGSGHVLTTEFPQNPLPPGIDFRSVIVKLQVVDWEIQGEPPRHQDAKSEAPDYDVRAYLDEMIVAACGSEPTTRDAQRMSNIILADLLSKILEKTGISLASLRLGGSKT